MVSVCVNIITPPEETEHGTWPGGRGPGGVPGGVGSKNRGGMCAYTEGSIRIQRGVYPIQPFELELILPHMAQKPMLCCVVKSAFFTSQHNTP